MEFILNYNNFKEKIDKYIYFHDKEIKENILTKEHENFIKVVNKAKTKAQFYIEKLLGKLPNNFNNFDKFQKITDNYFDDYQKISDTISFNDDDLFIQYLNKNLKDKTIINDGYCLKSKLIGKPVQMKNNEDLLGVIKDFDENNYRFLIIDFGEKEFTKIDIDELYIPSQTKIKDSN